MDIDRKRIAQLVQQFSQEPYRESSSEAMARRISPYHLAAAVLTRYHDKTLRPLGDPGASTIKDVLRNSELLPGDGAFPWSLRPEVRRQALRQLGSREALQAALDANQERPDNPTQALLEAYIAGDAPAMYRQTAAQLASTYMICGWLEGILPDLPEPEEVRARYDLVIARSDP